ncbi:hypothetical protein [Thermodesulfovibrio thiophilus]|uniref:hypothetical protein n=1 Tax=Thermodesulfovibrio thiophilus TaxID=340095 RepID=UPI0003FF5DFD|nr:hypothetical protein [Thermodesulfovibrio thiophilus]
MSATAKTDRNKQTGSSAFVRGRKASSIVQKKYRCVYCGIKTHNPEAVCALCRTGITARYLDLMQIVNRKRQQNKKTSNF